ncbi:MAG: hypothetical protein AAGG11_23025, partial [Pseudomonadota bacterium]
MARSDKSPTAKVVASVDLGSAQRTIGGILGQFHAIGIRQVDALRILSSVGLPAVAYEDPGFPISLSQDFELLNEICKRMSDDQSI